MGSEAPTQVCVLAKQVLYWLGCLPQPTRTLARMVTSGPEDTGWDGYWLGPGIASTPGLSLYALSPPPLALSANTKAIL